MHCYIDSNTLDILRMTSTIATNALASINRCLEADREGRPLQGQVPKTYQVYEGVGNEAIELEGKDYLVIRSTLPDGPLVFSPANNINMMGRTCHVVTPLGCVNSVVFDYTPGDIYVDGSILPSNIYTVTGPFSQTTIDICFYARNECTLSLDTGGALPVPAFYVSDGTLSGDREVDGDSNDLTFTNIAAFEIDSDSLALNTTTGSAGVLVDDGTGTIVADNDPSVNSITAAAGISGATLSGTLSENDISPGSNGQILETVLGTSVWLDKAVGVNQINSSGISGVLADDGTNIYVTSGPTVGSLTATGNVGGATLSGTLTESDVSPGSNGEVLATVGGTSTWSTPYSGSEVRTGSTTASITTRSVCDFGSTIFTTSPDITYNVGPRSYTPTVGQSYLVTLRFRVQCNATGTYPSIYIANYPSATIVRSSRVQRGSVSFFELYEMTFPMSGANEFRIEFEPDGGDYSVIGEMIEIRRVQ